jgi:DNA-directed RNA polymerase subunit beta'
VTIAGFDPFTEPIISEHNGFVRFRTSSRHDPKEELNEDHGNIEKKITEFTLESLQPRIVIEDKHGKELATYFLPGFRVPECRGRRHHPYRENPRQTPEGERKTRDITGVFRGRGTLRGAQAEEPPRSSPRSRSGEIQGNGQGQADQSS